MSHDYLGLSALQVEENRRKYGANIITPQPSNAIREKLMQVTSYWLIRYLLITEIVVLILFMGLNIFLDNITCEMGLILLVLAAIILLVYLVAILSGKWNENNHSYDVNPLISSLLVVIAFLGIIAYYQDVFMGVVGLKPYLLPIILTTIILLAIGVRHLLDCKNEKAFHEHNETSDKEIVNIIRDNNLTQVCSKEIVVGDVILLRAGDEIPADAELLESMNLVVDESALRGKTACDKSATKSDYNSETLFPKNHVMKGSTILSGEAIAQVFAVGNQTIFAENNRCNFVAEIYC